MNHPTDIQVVGVELFLLPILTRMPIKFGAEIVDRVTCARVRVTVKNRSGGFATGWGETPLSAQWAWPGTLSYAERNKRMCDFCRLIGDVLTTDGSFGHPIGLGVQFQADHLDRLLLQFNQSGDGEPMPALAALVCLSAFDIAVHDAYGNSVGLPVYETYNRQFMNGDLSTYLDPAETFRGRYPADFFSTDVPNRLVAWHLVGGLDPLAADDLPANIIPDEHPVALCDWVWRDGLKAVKVKLRGNDAEWDFNRLVDVGRMAIEWDVNWISADFNCTVRSPEYVNEILDKLRDDFSSIYGILLYVEQPFAYDLASNQIDVHSVSSRKPLFMDESAHDWRMVRLGRSLGWNGVALKTCKTQTGAILSLCWAKAHGMALMVQDLANPMLATIPHVLLAAHAGTIMGVETNASQFYPAASSAEAVVHPGIYRRRQGMIILDSIDGSGFGYRVDEIHRTLPTPASVYGDIAQRAGSLS